VAIGRRRIYSLAYADDVVIFADKEKEMRSLIKKRENGEIFG